MKSSCCSKGKFIWNYLARATALYHHVAVAGAQSDAVALLPPDGPDVRLQALQYSYQPGRRLLQCTTQAACIARCPAGNSPIYLAPQVRGPAFSPIVYPPCPDKKEPGCIPQHAIVSIGVANQTGACHAVMLAASLRGVSACRGEHPGSACASASQRRAHQSIRTPQTRRIRRPHSRAAARDSSRTARLCRARLFAAEEASSTQTWAGAAAVAPVILAL